MSPASESIRQRLRALSARERRLAVVLAGLRVAGGGAGGVALAAWMATGDVSRGAAWVLAAVLGTALGWHGVVRPLAQRWVAAGDPRHQARAVEAIVPALEGRLVTVAGRLDGPRGQESPALIDLVARRAWAVVEGLAPHAVWPAHGLRRPAAAVAVLWLATAAVVGRAPGGVAGVWSWWMGGDAAVGALQAATGRDDPLARLGDLTLRYVYPSYTGLEPYEVVNSTGEARAVPGTRVQVVARSAEAVDRASLAAYDDVALEASVGDDRRTVRGEFVVRGASGSWHLLTAVGSAPRRSPSYPIVPEPDLAPEVMLDVGARSIQVPIDGWIDGLWTVRDDFGVTEVALEIDGTARRPPLSRPSARQTEVADSLRARPIDLGMMPGQTYRVAVIASDNDTVSGAKTGRSEVIEVVVLDEQGVARVTDARRRELLDALVLTLADFLEEDFPPGRGAARWARWGASVHTRYEPLSQALAPYLGSAGLRASELWPVDAAVADGRALVRFTQVAFAPGGAGLADTEDVQTASTLRDTAIASLEDAALYMAGMLEAAAIARLDAAANRLQRDGAALAGAVESGTLDPAATGLRVAEAGTWASTLRKDADDLQDGALRRIVEDREAEIGRIVAATQAALARGDASSLAEAGQLAARVGRRIEDLGRAIRIELDRRRQRDEEARQQGKDLLEELDRIATEEESLASETAALRMARDEGLRERALAEWAAVDARVEVVVDGVTALLDDIANRGDRFNEAMFLEHVQGTVRQLDAASRARDLPGAIEELAMVEANWERFAVRRMYLASQRGGPSPAETRRVEAVRRAVSEGAASLEGLRRLDAATSPETSVGLERQRVPQGSLIAALDEAKGLAAKVVRKLPVTPRGLDEALDGATFRMQDAERALRDGLVMATEGSQEAAARHVRDAIEALKRAMQQASSMAREASGGAGGAGDESGGREREGDEEQQGPGGDEETRSPEPVQMPDPEAFQTDDDYRRALLEGMQADVPEAYRALKKRYYEDLVHQ